jgi:hypothetical protein
MEKEKKFAPKKDRLKMWMEIPPTKKTLGLLSHKGFSEENLKEIKTQYEAHIILKDISNRK